MNKQGRVGFALVLAVAATYLLLGMLSGWIGLVRRFHCTPSRDGLLCAISAVSLYAVFIGSILIVPLLIGVFTWFFHRLLAAPEAARPPGVSLGVVFLAYLAFIGLAGFAMTSLLDIPGGGWPRRSMSVLLAAAAAVAAGGLWRFHSAGRKLALAVLAGSILLTGWGLQSWVASFALRQWVTYLMMFAMEIGLLIYLMRPDVADRFKRPYRIPPQQAAHTINSLSGDPDHFNAKGES